MTLPAKLLALAAVWRSRKAELAFAHMERGKAVKRLHAIVAMVLVAVSLMAAPVSANNGDHGKGTPSSTTLDACGYFVGTQTSSNSSESTADGITTSSERGTWVGVSNNYDNGPVASLGTVRGSYSEVTTTYADGSFSGMESFNSGAGKIEQTFSFSEATGFNVQVTATRDLAFLTSDTNGFCYAGEFPRP